MTEPIQTILPVNIMRFTDWRVRDITGYSKAFAIQTILINKDTPEMKKDITDISNWYYDDGDDTVNINRLCTTRCIWGVVAAAVVYVAGLMFLGVVFAK